jgi:predicted nucleic acid-binding protein
MIVVSNSSPLIILYKCGLLSILEQLFGSVSIPEAVHHEVVHNTKDRQQSEAISQCSFIQVYPASTLPVSFSHKLDRGETEAIILASNLKADYLLLDDKRAQKEARQQGISYIPTFALLMKAAQKGIVPNFDALLAELERKNIFLNRELNHVAQDFLNIG